MHVYLTFVSIVKHQIIVFSSTCFIIYCLLRVFVVSLYMHNGYFRGLKVNAGKFKVMVGISRRKTL